MRIIAIESSGRHGSVAALHGENSEAPLIRQTVLGGGQRTAQALVPALHDLLADVGWPPQSIELVAVAVGPGSFTGLRIGVTTAKTFAYAVGANVIGVNTLVALAAQAPPSPGPLWTILDAQRQELFVAKFDSDPRGAGVVNCDTAIVSQDAWLSKLKPGHRVSGPPLRRLAPRLPDGIVLVPETFWQPMAAAVGQVAWQAYQAGQRDDVWKLAPHYYRPSYAEEKRARSEEPPRGYPARSE
jgi:tRNA threonylcarbamoyladenosine biosynthesis protein TsaB